MAITEHDLLVKGRVMAGMAFLDELQPGWERDINLDWLDISDPRYCALGQVFGNFFFVGALPEAQVAPYGFDSDAEVSCSELTQAWIAAIRERRGESVP